MHIIARRLQTQSTLATLLRRVIMTCVVLLIPQISWGNEPIPRVNWPSHATKTCQTKLEACFSRCYLTLRKKKDPQGKHFTPRISGLFCHGHCWSDAVKKGTCSTKPPVRRLIPQKVPPSRTSKTKKANRLSPFCKKFLDICSHSCIRNNAKMRDRQGRLFTLKVLQIFCAKKCWNLPARTRVCSLKKEQLITRSDVLLRQSKKELKQAQREDKLEQQRLLAQKKRVQQMRVSYQTTDKKERFQRDLQKRVQNKRTRELKKEKKALALERKKMQKVLKKLKRQATKQALAKRKRLLSEKRRFYLQKKQIQEQRKRLKILKKMLLSQKKSAARRKRQEHKRNKDQDKLLKEQQTQIIALKEERLQHAKRLQTAQKLITKEKRVAAKRRKLLKRKRRQKQIRKKKKLTKKLQALKKELARFRRQKRRFARRQKTFRARRQKRRRRLAMMRRKMRKINRRRDPRRGQYTPKQRAKTFFQKGKVMRARSLLVRAKKPQLVIRIDEFRSVLQNARRAYDKRDPNSAIPDLERALTLDLEFGANKSIYTKQIRLMLGNMYTVKGRLSMSQKFFPSAYIYFRAAKRYYPSHKTAKRQLIKLQKIAQGLYLRSKNYSKKSSYRRRILRKAVRIISKSSALYKTIQKDLR